jgi:hypothetical protein
LGLHRSWITIEGSCISGSGRVDGLLLGSSDMSVG